MKALHFLLFGLVYLVGGALYLVCAYVVFPACMLLLYLAFGERDARHVHPADGLLTLLRSKP